MYQKRFPGKVTDTAYEAIVPRAFEMVDNILSNYKDISPMIDHQARNKKERAKSNITNYYNIKR